MKICEVQTADRIGAHAWTARSGVTLILVLGILTLLLMLAGAFSITMRTERTATANFAENVRSRQMVEVGLGRALVQLRQTLGTAPMSGTNNVCPLWNVTNSFTPYTYVTNADLSVTTNNPFPFYPLADLLSGSASNYVPRILWNDAVAVNARDPTNHWMDVSMVTTTTVSGASVVRTNLVGRFAYLVLNVSDLMDVNVAGPRTAASPSLPDERCRRAFGATPEEIAVQQLDEINNGTYFRTNRTHMVRYETLLDYHAANPNLYGSRTSPGPSNPTHFVTHTLGRAGSWTNGQIRMPVNLFGSETDLAAKQTYIQQALNDAGFSAAEAGILFANLLDYVDADLVPRNWQTSVEPVPMIYEIEFSNQYYWVYTPPVPGPEQTVYCVNNSIAVEVWYPFVMTNDAQYQIRLASASVAVGGAPPGLPVPGALTTTWPPVYGHAAGGQVFQRVELTNGVSVTIGGPFTAYSPTVTWTVNANALDVRLNGTATLVDRLENAITVVNRNLNYNNTGTDGRDSKTLECLDPRFNGDPNNRNQWDIMAESVQVDPALNTVEFSGSTTYPDNSLVLMAAGAGGTLPGGVLAGQKYFAVNAGPNKIQLKNTGTLAIVDLTSAGSGMRVLLKDPGLAPTPGAVNGWTRNYLSASGDGDPAMFADLAENYTEVANSYVTGGQRVYPPGAPFVLPALGVAASNYVFHADYISENNLNLRVSLNDALTNADMVTTFQMVPAPPASGRIKSILRSAAELGNLVYSDNQPWRTVKLYGPGRQRVLDTCGWLPAVPFVWANDNNELIVAERTIAGLRINLNQSGLPVTLTTTTDLPGDLNPGTIYYVIGLGGDRIALADNEADALAPNRRVINNSGNGHQALIPVYVPSNTTWRSLGNPNGTNGTPAVFADLPVEMMPGLPAGQIASVDIALNQLSLLPPLDFINQTNAPVMFKSVGGTLPTPILPDTAYYAQYVSPNKIKLTYAMGADVDIGTSGSGVLLIMPARLSMADAQIVVRDKIHPQLTGLYTNLSELGRSLTDFSGLSVTPGSELAKEALFRNAVNLLTLRQNQFILIMEVRPASGTLVPKNGARQRAVATVARDPFTGELDVLSLVTLED